MSPIFGWLVLAYMMIGLVSTLWETYRGQPTRKIAFKDGFNFSVCSWGLVALIVVLISLMAGSVSCMTLWNNPKALASSTSPISWTTIGFLPIVGWTLDVLTLGLVIFLIIYLYRMVKRKSKFQIWTLTPEETMLKEAYLEESKKKWPKWLQKFDSKLSKTKVKKV